ncbi:hypothetical protein EFZ10_12960 [Tatumella sp. TA1]|nr:hypothetical protein EFZ10_12960 [Tatumella sp. TA1]
MYQSQEKRAWNRGARLAAIWKGAKKIFTRLDQRCVMLAIRYKLPEWIGRMPLLLAVLCSLIVLIAGGILISCSVVLLWTFIAAITHIGSSPENASTNSFNENKSQNNFHDDFVMNSAINNEYDGAPYKSPSED